MFRRTLSAALALSLTLSVVPMVQAEDNIIANAGFETGVENNIDGFGAVTAYPNKKNATFELDTENKVSGQSSLKVSATEAGTRSYIEQTVDVMPNTKYTLSANIKTQIASGAPFAVYLYEKPVGSTNTNEITQLVGKGTSDWGLYEDELVTASETNQVVVRLILGSTWDSASGSTVWIDDLKLVKENDLISVDGVSITETLEIKENEVSQLMVEFSPIDATNQNVTFSSDDESVATVSSAGIVQGISPGTATITVETADGNFTDICSVTVLEETSSEKNYAINGGFESVVTLENTDANYSYWKDGKAPIYWNNLFKPSGKDVASFSLDTENFSEGTKSVKIEGASANTRTAFNSVQLIDDATKVYKLSIDIKSENIEGSGAYLRTQYFSNVNLGHGPTTDYIKGTSDWTTYEMFMTDMPAETEKIVIDMFLENASGIVWYDNLKITETYSLNLDLENAKVNMNDNILLNATLSPEQPDKVITWTSSNEDVATVTSDGLVTGIIGGVSEITATTVDGHKATCVIEVVDPTYNQYYAEMRDKWKDNITLNNFSDKTNADYLASVALLDESVAEILASYITDDGRTKLWDDLDVASVSADITTAYNRLRTLATAYATDTSVYYQNADVLDKVLSGVSFMYDNCYNENVVANKGAIYDNWYDWNISAPKALNNIMVLLFDEMSEKSKEESLRTIEYYNSDPYVAIGIYNNPITMTGANLLDKLVVASVSGILGENSKNLNITKEGISTVLPYVTTGDGFYEDGSFIQHQSIPYVGGYGAVLMTGLSQILFLTEGTPWEVTDPLLDNAYNWILEGFAPLYHNGVLMDMVSGRGISRSNSSDFLKGRGSMMRMLSLANTAEGELRVELLSFLKTNLATATAYSDTFFVGMNTNDVMRIKSLLNDTSIPTYEELNLHKVYGSQDRVVHHTNNFALGISMYSERVSSFEYGNGENKKGWHTADGATYLYNDDIGQFGEDFWPTVDMHRLPGTTSDGSDGTIKDWNKVTSSKDFVGGSSIYDLYGATVMEFEMEEGFSTLNGKKSWFAFDDEIVALGSSINSTDDRLVETIVENRKIRDTNDNQIIVNGDEILTSNGSELVEDTSWVYLSGNVGTDSLGYYFPENNNVSIKRETRTGSWNEINNSGSSDEISKNYVSLALEHGENPVEEAYSYVLLPNKSQEEVSRYADNSNIEIIENSQKAHAVYEKNLKMLGINFFEATTVGKFTSNDKVSVMIHESGNGYTISMSDPTHKKDEITLTIDEELYLKSGDANCEVLDGKTTLTLDTKDMAGASQTVSLEKKSISRPRDETTDIEDGEIALSDIAFAKEQIEKFDELSQDTKQGIIDEVIKNLPYTAKSLESISTDNAYLRVLIENTEYFEKIGINVSDYVKIIQFSPKNIEDFIDVESNAWYYNDIIDINKLGIAKGYEDNSFKPNKNLTTKEAMVFLERIFLNNDVNSTKNNQDLIETLDKNDWAYHEIASIGTKISKETFEKVANTQSNNIERGLVFQVIFETLGDENETYTNSFSDSEGTIYAKAAAFCKENAIIQGDENGNANVHQLITRAEMATILNNMLK